MFRRDKLLAGLDVGRLAGAEIGALASPHVTRDEGRIFYIDHADTETLRSKYASHKHVDVTKIVDVDAVWGTQPLNVCIGQHVDYVLASHVIEHVPDVITWLDEIRSVLKTGGTLRLAIPDRRFTFDYRRKETQLYELLNANIVKARTPLPICILDHIMNVCQLDLRRAWEGNLSEEDLKPFHDMQAALSMAIDALQNGTYHDVHCWVFTPSSFADLFEQACRNGVINFACEFFYDTEPGQLEFIVALSPSTDRDEMTRSWRAMKESARSFGNRS